MERCIYKNLIFIAWENWCRGPQDFHLPVCLDHTYAKNEENLCLYFSSKGFGLDFPFLPYFRFFLNIKCQKHGEGAVLSKNKCHIWTHHTRIPIYIHCLRKKILAPEKHCPHIVSVMWPENLEFVLLGSLFHWYQAGCLWCNSSVR